MWPGAPQARAEECEDPEDQSLAPDSGPQDGATVQKIKQDGYLTVGVDQNSYRLGYRDPNSTSKTATLEGFDIDLAHAIADEILGKKDAEVRFKAIPTNERIPAIQGGKVDMVVRTMTINCDRLEDVAFSSPYFETGQQVLAPKKSDITGYDNVAGGQADLHGEGLHRPRRTEGGQAGRPPRRVRRHREATVPNQLDCLVRLQLGEVDAVVTDGALAASQAAQDPTVELKGEPFTDEYYGVAMKKDATDLIRRVNQILVDYRKADWQKSYDTWLAGTLGKGDGPPAVQYK